MDVSILISTKDRAQFLSRTLDSLSRVRTDSFEVELIVIDNECYLTRIQRALRIARPRERPPESAKERALLMGGFYD